MEKTMHYTSVNHAHQAIEQINQLRNRRELCDIILRCNETRIFAHKLVLSVNSPYFKGLMNTRYYMEPGLYEHPLKGIEGDAVQTIVNFFYTATVSVNEESVWTLLPAAAKLHVAEIQSLCSNFLLSILDIDNCLKIHHIATECLASNLLKESTDFIKENFDKLLDEDCFLDLEFNEAMPHLKRLGDTGLTNDQVLHAIKCWMVAAIDERQVFGLQIIKKFPNLATKLEEFIPLEFLESESEIQENGVGSHTNSDRGGSDNSRSPHNNKAQGTDHSPTIPNGKAEENYMCFECAEEFDTKTELEEHAKGHKVYIKKENISPNQNNASKQSSKSGSPNSLSYSPTPTKFSTPPPRSFSPYEDYIKMNANKSLDFSSSLSSYLNNTDDSGGSYFDQYMRARGLDSPSFGQRYSRSPTPSRVQSATTNPLLITVTSGTEDGSDMKFICPVCGKSYLDKDSLSRHYETHSHFPCKVCGKTYSTKSNLHTHMKKHSDDKTYSCNTCDKTFTSPSVLKTHLRTHSGEKPFICPTCGVAFAKNIHLKRHLSIHTGIKPHECKVCNKRFSRSDHLKRHVQSIHTQDRPHICSLCGKDFVRKYELNKHMKQSHWGFTVGEEDQEMDSSTSEAMDTSSIASMHAAMAKGFVPFSESKADTSMEEEKSPSQKGLISPHDRIPVTVKEEPISPAK
ncbi:uncharacterized protein LOC111099659 isoform X2 [Crassostrea virginica]